MIIVTGTKRSGTSLWMQVLIAAGFPHFGTAFPGLWEQSIREANPRGFYESKFRQGIYFATNPDPDTGAFLQPKQVLRHVVKVFIPGLIRTDYSYIGPVIATMRDWREYCSSLRRLHAMEDRFRASQEGETTARSFPDEKIEAIVRAGQLPPALEWWFENYDLVRDMATRRYPFHMLTYDRLLRDPEAEISKVLRWLGEGDREAACRVVEPSLRTQQPHDLKDEIVSDFADVFDEFYRLVDRAGSLDAAFVEKLNQTNQALTARWEEVSRARRSAARSVLDS